MELLPIEIKFATRIREVHWEMDQQVLGHASCHETDQVNVVQVVATKPTQKGKINVSVVRQRVRITSDMLRAWVAEAQHDLHLLALSDAAVVWTKNTASCMAFGKACPYTSLCLSGQFAPDMAVRWRAAASDAAPAL